MRTTCSAVQCNHVTVDRNNINLALILIFTSTAIVQSVIGRWREKVVGRRRRFVHPLRHFWRRFCTGRRSCRTLGATTFRAADNQEESDQATEWSHVPYQWPRIHHPLVLWKKGNWNRVSIQVSQQWNKASGKFSFCSPPRKFNGFIFSFVVHCVE